MVVVAKLPPLSGRAMLEENEELSVETSNPAGAEMVTGPASSLPLTVSDCAEEGVPLWAVKLPRLDTEGVITEFKTAPLRATDSVAAPGLEIARFPETEPVGAPVAMRV